MRPSNTVPPWLNLPSGFLTDLRFGTGANWPEGVCTKTKEVRLEIQQIDVFLHGAIGDVGNHSAKLA